MNTFEPIPDFEYSTAATPVSSSTDLASAAMATENQPFGKPHRNGKVPRVPSGIRSRINQILQDGLPYLQIIQKSNASATSLTQPSASPNPNLNPKTVRARPSASPNGPSPNSTTNSTSCKVHRHRPSSS